MKTLMLLMILSAVIGSAAAGETVHPEDSELIMAELEDYFSETLLVSLAGSDSAVVLFAAVGGEWRGDELQWNQLLLLSSIALHLDLRRDWDLKDIAVSFGDSWCRIPADKLLELAAMDLAGDEMEATFRSFVEVRSMDESVD